MNVEACVESDDHSPVIVRALENGRVIRSRHADFTRVHCIETRASQMFCGRAR